MNGTTQPAVLETSQPSQRKSRAAGLVLLGLVAVVVGYAYGVEPYWIEVTHHELRAAHWTGGALKIAHLSDVHTSGIGRREQNLLALLEQEKPDVIMVTGDTLTAAGGFSYWYVEQFLSRLHAPLGVWVVRGNWENWRRPFEEEETYRRTGVHFLVNRSGEIRPGVWVAGFDEFASGVPSRQATLGKIPAGAYIVALFHSPGYFDYLAGRVPLALAGHTHGGQVRIPGLPPVWLPRGSREYVAGWYEKRGSWMHVSRGIGTSVLPIRLFCRPELAIITVNGPVR